MVTPPSGFTQLIEIYRGVEIWYNPTSPRYWCQPASGYESFEYTVQGCRNYIDLVLGPVTTPLPTTLTLTAPTSAAEKVPFTVSGQLTYREGGVDYGLGGRTIILTGADAAKIVITGSGGAYSASLTISQIGTYTITASYAGETGLSAADAYGFMGVTELEGSNLGGLILIGLGLFVGYQILK